MEQGAIAVHGVGMVGGALSRYLKKKGRSLYLFDPPKDLKEAIENCSIHFLCVPTPYQQEGCGFDLQYIDQAMETIREKRGDQETIIVIRSTVLPGTTKSIQEAYPEYTLLFNPEFLTEKNADRDMEFPERQIIGYVDDRGKAACSKIIQLLPKAEYQRAMTATEAELVKYFGNAFLSVKVIYANIMYDFCQAMGLDYDLVSDAAAHDSRIGSSHLNVLHGGYRGYGGTCFPKDIRALIQKGEEYDIEVGLLKEAERFNTVLTEGVDHK